MAVSILWVDDEIEFLKPHIIFLEKREYKVSTATNGVDAIELVGSQNFDLVFLDENMPGLSGMETLSKLKALKPNMPVVMVTKSEEESIMDQAIGSKIADYLIKPVNPKQILLSIKKHVHQHSLVSEKTTSDYQQAFGRITQQISQANTFDQWVSIYRKLAQWGKQIEESSDPSVGEIFSFQMNEANNEFGKYIKANYLSWFSGGDENRPLMSHNVMRQLVFPTIDNGN